MSSFVFVSGNSMLRREKLPSSLKDATREQRESNGYFDLECNMPKSEHGEVYVASGYERTDVGYRRIYKKIEFEHVDEPTMADKDAALRSFGVEV